ncbi:MAG: V-type ATPase subunit [Candidatus Bathyarchaeia archaeon]
MRGTSHYALAVALTGALKSFTLTPSQYEAMLRIKDPYKILTMLEETVYKQTVSEVLDKTLNIENIERALLVHYYDVFRKVLTVTPAYVKPLLNAILGRHELTCLKTLIKLLAQDVKPEEAFRTIIPVGRYNEEVCKIILNMRDISRIIDFLKLEEVELISIFSSLFHIILSQKIGYTAPLETAIDKYAMIRVWNEVQKLKGYDKKMAEHLIGVEIDAMNIMTVLRIKNIGVDITNMGDLIIPAYYKITNDTLIKMYIAPSIPKAMDILMESYYGKVTLPGREKTLFEIEVSLKRHIAKESAKIFQGDRFHVGILIGFLNLKFYEANDLITIINGKIREIPEEDIKKALILY